MGLIRKMVTSAVLAVNRANSRRSTGPRSELGKGHASRNSSKHLIFARVSLSLMKELGEDPADLEKLQEGLRQDLQPQGSLEEMLVHEMAENRWRLGRLYRAEMGILAVQQLQLEYALRPAPAKSQASWDNLSAEPFGLAGVSESPDKNRQVLGLLDTLRADFERAGFTRKGLELLETIYGSSPGVPGAGLITQYKAQMKVPKSEPIESETESAAVDDEGVEGALERFLESLDHEINTFKQRLRVLSLAQKLPLPESVKNTKLLLERDDLDRLMQYETHLDRQFHQKLQQLVAWRRAKGQLALPNKAEIADEPSKES